MALRIAPCRLLLLLEDLRVLLHHSAAMQVPGSGPGQVPVPHLQLTCCCQLLQTLLLLLLLVPPEKHGAHAAA